MDCRPTREYCLSASKIQCNSMQHMNIINIQLHTIIIAGLILFHEQLVNLNSDAHELLMDGM